MRYITNIQMVAAEQNIFKEKDAANVVIWYTVIIFQLKHSINALIKIKLK